LLYFYLLVDKQAAARCWTDGQKKRCFTDRFLATGTVEEKIFQRQLSKEGLQSVVHDEEQVNTLSTKDFRNLFKLRTTSPSDTHDKLDCKRSKTIQENSEAELAVTLPLQLAECRTLLQKLCAHEDKTQNPEIWWIFEKPKVSSQTSNSDVRSNKSS